jgi:saccharopine dehydrogenase-like NADP-dependent oxidoreductase
MKILVLGGAGKMGSVAVQDLALNPRVSQVIIADVNVQAAGEIAQFLNSSKIRIEQVDLSDRPALVGVLQQADACVNATVYYTNLNVMEACLEARTHYTDLGGLFHTTRKQLELHQRFEEAGVSAVLGMGTAPGLPNIQSRYAADRLDTIEYVHIYDGIRPPSSADLQFSYAVPTIIDEMTLSPVVYRGGEFVTCQPVSEVEDYWFSAPLGLLTTHLSLHSEVATLPVTYADKGIQECFFKINYWGMTKEVVEKVKVLEEFGFTRSEPVNINGKAVIPRDLMTALMGNYVPVTTTFLEPSIHQPPDWVKEIVTEVKGTKDGRPCTYRVGTLTCKSPLPTGVVPARGAVWQAEKRVPPGVHPPERAFDPVPFLKELEAREIYTQISVTEML